MSDTNKKDLYNSRQYLNNALERIKKDKNLLPENKELILKFDKQLKAEKVSAKRRKKVVMSLPVLLHQLNKPLKGSTKEDLVDLVGWINDGANKGWSETTQEDYKALLKRVWIFANDYEPEDKPKEVRFIKSKKIVTPPTWLPSDELVTKAIDCCLNPRDKFIIATLRECGFRTGELCYMKLEDWCMDGELIEVKVSELGKTGPRTIYIRNVMSYYKQWIAVHPRRNEPEAPLLVNLEGRNFGKRMSPFNVLKVVKHAFARAGTKKNVSIQLLRKRNCTEMAGKLNAQDLNDRQGWTQGSKMAGYYVKFSKDHKKELAEQLYGIKNGEEKKKERTVTCVNPLCGELNPAQQKYCWKCHAALSVDAAMEVKKLRDMINKDQAEFYKTGDINWILTKIEARLDALEGKK